MLVCFCIGNKTSRQSPAWCSMPGNPACFWACSMCALPDTRAGPGGLASVVDGGPYSARAGVGVGVGDRDKALSLASNTQAPALHAMCLRRPHHTTHLIGHSTAPHPTPSPSPAHTHTCTCWQVPFACAVARAVICGYRSSTRRPWAHLRTCATRLGANIPESSLIRKSSRVPFNEGA